MNCTYHNLPTVWVVDIDQGCSRAVKSQLSDVGVWSMVGELHVENDYLMESVQKMTLNNGEE